jgi:2-deoxy-D-gluconate 3-dehydrogenase
VTSSSGPGSGEELSGSLAVVIGAGQGIGAAIAVALGRAGADVVVAGRALDRLGETADVLTEMGAGVGREEVDVSSPQSIERLSAAVLERYTVPTVLVNSAGAGEPKDAFDVTEEDWNLIHDVHLRGTFFSCQAFGREMARRSYGKIINLSSTWAATVGARRSVYCAAKAGVSHLTSALAVEWAPLGIRVNALAPTATKTPALEQRLAGDPKREDYLRARIPLGRLARPEDIVGASIFLASPASDFVTGHTLFVDGGWRTAR